MHSRMVVGACGCCKVRLREPLHKFGGLWFLITRKEKAGIGRFVFVVVFCPGATAFTKSETDCCSTRRPPMLNVYSCLHGKDIVLHTPR